MNAQKKVMFVDDEESVRARFFNDLQEAVCVARGSAAAVLSMTRGAQADLWRSVVDGERRLAWRGEEELGSRRGGAESSSGGGSGGAGNPSRLASRAQGDPIAEEDAQRKRSTATPD